jgi:hypothetical protein
VIISPHANIESGRQGSGVATSVRVSLYLITVLQMRFSEYFSCLEGRQGCCEKEDLSATN